MSCLDGARISHLTSASIQVEDIPSVLISIYVCITFHWNVARLSTIKQVLLTVLSYPVEKEVLIVTNRPERLNETIGLWGLYNTTVVGPASDMQSPLHLTWEHRSYMEKAMTSGNYSTFMYLEEDILLTWPTLLSWARDTELLEPWGMQRSMFRVEVAPWNGRYVLTDETKGNISTLKVVNCSNAASNQHSHYTQLSFSYMGMWVYTASQMAAFMNSKYWSVTILDQDNTDLVREYAAWGFQRQELRGFQHSNMVPLDLQNTKLFLIAAVEHLPNNYAKGHHRGPDDHSSPQEHGSVPVDSYIQANADIEYWQDAKALES